MPKSSKAWKESSKSFSANLPVQEPDSMIWVPGRQADGARGIDQCPVVGKADVGRNANGSKVPRPLVGNDHYRRKRTRSDLSVRLCFLTSILKCIDPQSEGRRRLGNRGDVSKTGDTHQRGPEQAGV